MSGFVLVWGEIQIINFLFITSIILLCLSITVWYQSRSAVNLLESIIIAVTTMFSYLSIIAILFSIPKIDINLSNLFFVNSSVLFFLFYYLIKQKFKLKFVFNTLDLFAVFIAFLSVAIVFFGFFNGKFDIRFLSTDSAIHLMFANFFARSGKLLFIENDLKPFYDSIWSNYPFLTYTNFGLMIRTFVNLFDIVKLYILWNLFIYFLIILATYRILVRYITKKDYFILFISLFSVAFGYILSSLIYGFGSQQTGILMVLVLIFLAEKNSFVPQRLRNILIIINSIGLLFAYYYYLPFAVIAIIILNINQNDRRSFVSILSKRNLIFIISNISFLFLYLFFFKNPNGLSNKTVLALDGYIYRDLFDSFIPFLLFACFSSIVAYKQKKIEPIYIFTLFLFCYMLLMFFLTINGIASAYYYYKNHFVLHILVIILFGIGLSYLKSSNQLLYKSYVVLAIFLSINYIGLDKYLNSKYPSLNPHLSESMGNIYKNNINDLKSTPVILTNEQKDLIEHIDKERKIYLPNNNSYLPVVGTSLQRYWFRAITTIWPKYDDDRIMAEYMFNYQAWKKDPNKNPYLLLFIDSGQDWLKKENIDLSEFDIVDQRPGLLLMKLKQ